MKLVISNRLLSTLTQLVCVLVLMLGLHSVSYAQKPWSDDPLKNPQVWKELVKNPTDTTLWAKYCKKPQSKMSIKQLEEMNLWKQELMLRQLAEQEAVVGFKLPDGDSDIFIDETAFSEIMSQIKAAKDPNKKQTKGDDGKVRHVSRIELAGMEAIILQEQSELVELKQNINANFALIEEYYKEIFQEYNLEYVYYKDKYPNKKYSEVRWVEDQEKRLKEVKAKQIQDLRKKFVVNAGK